MLSALRNAASIARLLITIEAMVAGGGTALLRAANALTVKGKNLDQEAGINIVRRALQAPAHQIATNAAEFADLIALGIVDPVKVVRSALQNAASIASLLITTDTVVAGGRTALLPAANALTVKGNNPNQEVSYHLLYSPSIRIPNCHQCR